MKKQNPNTLRKALEELPLHQPPEAVWDRLAADLDEGKHMPLKAAPLRIWNKLEARLNRRSQWRKARPFAIAAAAVLLVGSFWLGFSALKTQPQGPFSLSEKQAQESPQLLPAEDLSQSMGLPGCWSEDEAATPQERAEWQKLKDAYLEWQLADSPGPRDSLRAVYLVKKENFVESVCQ